MTAKAVFVDCCFGVWIHAALEEPLRDLEFVVVGAEVKQSYTGGSSITTCWCILAAWNRK